jgi:hypothetical protein
VPGLANGGTQNIPISGDVDINENRDKSEKIAWELRISHSVMTSYIMSLMN